MALSFMLMDDSAKDPAVVLPYLVGRPLAATEVYEAFGYRKSAYYKAAHEGRLITADNLIRAAKYFGLNPIDLQVRYGLIEPESVAEYVESEPSPLRLRDLRRDPSRPPV
jgi:plasmid maintenance system antidote protein VapI